MTTAEKTYRTIFENAIEGLFQSTPEGRFLNANPALARTRGYESRVLQTPGEASPGLIRFNESLE